MERKANPNLLRVLLGLFFVASFAYWVAGVRDNWELGQHTIRHVAEPFDYNSDTGVVTSVQPEAKAAGIVAGDRITGLNGARYKGMAQWYAIVNAASPGEQTEVEFARPDGSMGNATVTLTRHPPLHPGVADWAVLLSFSVVVCFLPLLCLLIGYWVVLAKPTDRNAWLLLVLLTLPSVLVVNQGIATGAGLLLRLTWYNAVQLVAFPALLLFGVYFPERSRIDKQVPWLKWVVIAFYFAAALPLYTLIFKEFYSGTTGAFWPRAGKDSAPIFYAFFAACILLFLVFVFDKLRSASTADARRRMRVLVFGMAFGLGALLVVVLLYRLGAIDRNTASGFWISVVGAVLFMVAPLTLAYVVLVQRAMDVRMIVRMGARYALAKAVLLAAQWILVGLAVWLLLVPALNRRRLGAAVVAEVVIFLLLVLALRMGVQKRAQNWLDRKFFREAYDAELVLNELSDEVRRFTDTAPLLETVTRRVAETLHVDQIVVLLRGSESFHLAQAIGVRVDGAMKLPAQASSVRYLSSTNEPARLYRNDPDAWYLMAGMSEREVLDAVNAELLLPLPGRNRLMGLMVLGPKRSEAAYTKADLHMLQTVATQTGLALEVTQLARSLAAEAAQRELVNREMAIAREVQERLFPQEMPEIEGATIAGHCRPALGVGGDYYDVFRLDDGRVGLAIGDVSGKGFAAALLMASLRASLRGVSLDNPRDFAKLMDKVNRLVYEASAENRYATFFFAAYDSKTRRLDCVNAGHNPPVLLRCGNGGTTEVIRLEANGPVVGLLPAAPYTEQSLTLRPGDLLVMFTDGISEAMAHGDEEWGEERMIASAELCRDKTAAAALKDLFRDADRFTAGAPQHDDMTMLVLKLEG